MVNWATISELTINIQMSKDGGLDQHSGGGSRNKCTDMRYVSEIVLLDLADGLNVREERKCGLKVSPLV